MVTCKLKGGLGNQLFQIATVCNLAMENNDSYVFNFEDCYTPMQGFQSSKYKETIYNNFHEINNLVGNNFYVEPTFEYKQIPYSNNIILDGYFQSEKYFYNNKDNIVKLFDLNYKSDEICKFLEQIPKPVTSVHIRRGDYLPYTHIVNALNEKYYLETIQIINDKTQSFLMFSDDITWVKEKYKLKNVYFSEFNDELCDLILMSKCDNNIIANSTFSWWGAYLNKNKNKTVLSPKIWFNPSSGINDKDIIPNSWIKI